MDDDSFPTSGKKSGLRGIPWKDFSRVGFTLKKDEHSTGKISENSFFTKQGEKSDLQKSKRETKKRDLSGMYDDDDEDDEIRYLEKLKTSRASGGLKDVGKESSIKHRSLSRVSKGARYDNLNDFGPSKSGKDGKKYRSEGVSDDTDYEEEPLSDSELEVRDLEGRKKKIPRKDSPGSPTESKREFALTTRQRARLKVKDASSLSSSNSIEFPNGLPPPPPRSEFLVK